MSFASNKDLLAVTSNSEIGSIIRIAKTSAPTGFLACNGQAVSRSTYSELFSVIGTNFGVGDGSTTFNVPFDTSLKQYDLTVTSTGWTTTEARGVPYQDSEGVWRLKFNIAGTVSSTLALNLTVTGVTFSSDYDQAVATWMNAIAANHGFADAGTSVIDMDATATGGTWRVSGDVELDSKPTWVDDNGSDYSINQYIRYAPRTALNAISQSVASKSASHTILDSDGISKFLVTTGSSANVTITLPDASSNPNREIEIIKVDSGTKFVEIAKAGSDTVRGSATSIYAIQQYESIKLIASGTDWVLLGDPLRTVSALIANSGTPTVSTQSSTFISSLTDNSTGDTTININTGVFTNTPWCTGNTVYTSERVNCSISGVSSSSARVRTYSINPTAIADAGFSIILTGLK